MNTFTDMCVSNSYSNTLLMRQLGEFPFSFHVIFVFPAGLTKVQIAVLDTAKNGDSEVPIDEFQKQLLAG